MNELNSISKDFPILDQFFNVEPLVYLDNAATTQKPQQVLDVLADYYQQHPDIAKEILHLRT